MSLSLQRSCIPRREAEGILPSGPSSRNMTKTVMKLLHSPTAVVSIILALKRMQSDILSSPRCFTDPNPDANTRLPSAGYMFKGYISRGTGMLLHPFDVASIDCSGSDGRPMPFAVSPDNPLLILALACEKGSGHCEAEAT